MRGEPFGARGARARARARARVGSANSLKYPETLSDKGSTF